MRFRLRDSARRVLMFASVAGAMAVWWPAHAADVGGYLADQQKASALAAAKSSSDECPQVIARAATDNSALAAYRAALCYMQVETPDPVAARAWLTRSSEMGFLPAQRMLRSLQIAEAGPHSPVPHCHVLGEGQQICHGGAAPPALATAATK